MNGDNDDFCYKKRDDDGGDCYNDGDNADNGDDNDNSYLLLVWSPLRRFGAGGSEGGAAMGPDWRSTWGGGGGGLVDGGLQLEHFTGDLGVGGLQDEVNVY